MLALPSSRTVSVHIACAPDTIVRFVSNPLNLPLWARQFCLSVRRSGAKWQVETPQGMVTIRFVAPNALGVLDHYVGLPSGEEIYAPMRALASGDGSEVLFTLLRLPEMSDAQFEEDAAMVERDLQTLKAVMESGANRA
ncbi:MAG: SRPBCC family protein [Burkholderiaceae bacterium]